MADSSVATVGIVGPAGPGSVSPGAVITSRGGIIVGNASAVPAQLLVGPNGQYLRSNGADLLYSAILAADLPTGIDAAKLNTGVVSNAEFNHLDGVTSPLQTQIDGKAASAHAHILNTERGIFIAKSSASNASPSDNTTSTVTYAVALQLDVVLPTGTWKIHALGGVGLAHSAGGTVQMRVSVNGQDSVARSYSATSATIYSTVVDEDDASGLTGTISVYVHFRSITAGTTNAKQPWILAIAERTA